MNLKWRSLLPRFLAGVIGMVLLVAALSKSMDMALFIRQLREYGILSQQPFLTWSAWGVIVAESGLGAGLLVFYRPRLILSLTALLFLLFIGATASAWWSGSTTECGCFGSWVKRSPGEALIENLILLSAILVVRFGPWSPPEAKSRVKLLSVVAASLIGLALPLLFGFSMARVGQPGWAPLEKELGGLQIQGIQPLDMRKGEFLLVLIDTGCDHCADAVEDLNALARKGGLPRLIGLCMNDADRRRNFQQTFHPAFPLGRVKETSFWRLLGQDDLPCVILLRDLKVRQVWSGKVPAENRIRKFL